MCQYRNNCKEFQPSKDKKANSSVCVVLCLRNPQLDYEITDKYRPIVLDTADVDLEKNSDFLSKGVIDSLKKDVKQRIAEEIDDDKTLTRGQKRDMKTKAKLAEVISESIDIQDIHDAEFKEPQSKSLGETLVSSGKYESEKKKMEDVVRDNLIENTDVSGGVKVPRRKRRGRGGW